MARAESQLPLKCDCNNDGRAHSSTSDIFAFSKDILVPTWYKAAYQSQLLARADADMHCYERDRRRSYKLHFTPKRCRNERGREKCLDSIPQKLTR